MTAYQWTLSVEDCRTLKISDAYSVHRVVYDLFEDVRNEKEKNTHKPSGILYADKGMKQGWRKIVILADRKAKQPSHGELEGKDVPEKFLDHDRYGFEVMMNPTRRDRATGKTVAIRERERLEEWFLKKAEETWGFAVEKESVSIHNIGAQTFKKSKEGPTVTHHRATFIGKIRITDREKFKEVFKKGIGRARAFGFGLLQIVPIV